MLRHVSQLRPSPALVVASLSLVVALGGVTYAATKPSQINGCLKKTGRALYVPEAGNSCKTGDIPIAWNEKGPAGPRGLKGEPGAPGAKGETSSPERKAKQARREQKAKRARRGSPAMKS